MPYAVEEDRGYEHLGSMHSPGTVSVTLTEGEDLFLSASTETWEQMAALSPAAAFELELTRRERLLASSDEALQLPETFLLPLAADQFIVRPATRVRDEAQARAVGADARTVIAGYHWFTDWGRDTMISLEGLALVTGRHHEARDILRTFGLHVRNGLIPNLFPEGEREGLYHTADATMWFFHALHRYDTVTGDRTLVDELLPALEEIVQRHREGTLFNIHVDADGLLTQGADGVQLTWMDALVDGWVVTPRRGKPVEINALWHNALVLLASWMVRAGRGMLAEDIAREAHRCRESFNARFWNASRQRLYDVVDGERGDDDACRPNQIVALAVTHSPLERDYWEPVLNSVASELLTPVGLRTLSPAHPDYKRRYFGALRARDAAYHQGTVWPWLIGSFIDAWLAVHPDDAEGARTLLSPLLAHVTSAASVGSISEIFDAEAPFTARGCVAQAWSVAEVSRALVKLASLWAGAGRRRGRYMRTGDARAAGDATRATPCCRPWVTGDVTWVYEQVFETTFTLVTFSVAAEAEPVALPAVAAPVVPAVVPAPVVPAVPVVPAPVVPAVLPEVVAPALVMLPALGSIVPVSSTFWLTYWLSTTVDPAFSISVLCAPMVAVEPVLPVRARWCRCAARARTGLDLRQHEPATGPCGPGGARGPWRQPSSALGVLGVVLPIEPLALEGTRHPVTVMVLPACALGVVCAGGVVGEVDGVEVL